MRWENSILYMTRMRVVAKLFKYFSELYIFLSGESMDNQTAAFALGIAMLLVVVIRKIDGTTEQR